MNARFRTTIYALTIVTGIAGFSLRPQAQGAAAAVDCSKPLSAITGDWMNTTFDSGGAKATDTVTIDGDKVVLKENIGTIWLSYTFRAQDIQSVEEGGNDDGVIGIAIKATPFQFANSRGESTPPAGVSTINVDYPAEAADQALAGFKKLQQRGACH